MQCCSRCRSDLHLGVPQQLEEVSRLGGYLGGSVGLNALHKCSSARSLMKMVNVLLSS